MFRLNQRAFDILQAELLRSSRNDLAGQVQRDLALRRLEKLRVQTGIPLTRVDLRETIADLFPNFSETVLQAAARANCPSPLLGRVRLASVVIVGMAGSGWKHLGAELAVSSDSLGCSASGSDRVAAQFYQHGSKLSTGDRCH